PACNLRPTCCSPRQRLLPSSPTAQAGAVPRAASSSVISPSLPSDGGEGWGEEARPYWFPLSLVLSPLVPRRERMVGLMQPWGGSILSSNSLCLPATLW